MEKTTLREKQAEFQFIIEEKISQYKKLEVLRKEFVKHYSIDKIKKMNIDEFVIGKEPNKGFCYMIETKLEGLGSISGTTAIKFGVYYGYRGKKKNINQKKEYHYPDRLNVTNAKEAFEKIRKSILEIIDAGEKNDAEALISNKILSPTFKGKILSVYFPKRFLNIFSEEFLNHYLNKFNLDTTELLKSDPIIKRQALLEFKDSDEIMRTWSVEIFSEFLYSKIEPPVAKNIYKDNKKKTVSSKNETEQDDLEDYLPTIFPLNPKPEFIDLNILPAISDEGAEIVYDQKDLKGFERKSGKGKKNYTKLFKRYKEYGDRGEYIVKNAEINELKSFGMKDLSDKVEQVSDESDSYGFDILSYEIDGREKHIEVKATSAPVGNASFFITENEIRKAKQLQNYYLYIVFEVTSVNPKIWRIKNPFNPKNEDVVLKPNIYRVNIKAS